MVVSASTLTLSMCAAEVLSMAAVFTFPTLLPSFLGAWGLSHTQAGWINGMFFAGYTAAVPVLASLTDRVDARRIYLGSALLSGLAAIGFALLARGFWTALLFRTLGGVGLAGTFIPGLKTLVDRLAGKTQARAIAFYTASFSIGSSLSFFAGGLLGARYGWQTTFACMGGLTLLSIAVAAAALRPKAPVVFQGPGTRLLDFRPVLRNRRAMAYILTYVAHMWELFSVRSWIVAFLAFSAGQAGWTGGFFSPATVASLAALAGMGASVAGAELALRFDRKRVVTWIMVGSAVFALGIGFTVAFPYPLVAILCLLYGLLVQGDSAALHTGAVQAAEPRLRGATMAVQSLLGFASAAVAPVAVGLVLQATGGGRSVVSWGAAYITIGLGVALGPFILSWLSPSPGEETD